MRSCSSVLRIYLGDKVYNVVSTKTSFESVCQYDAVLLYAAIGKAINFDFLHRFRLSYFTLYAPSIDSSIISLTDMRPIIFTPVCGGRTRKRKGLLQALAVSSIYRQVLSLSKQNGTRAAGNKRLITMFRLQRPLLPCRQ